MDSAKLAEIKARLEASDTGGVMELAILQANAPADIEALLELVENLKRLIKLVCSKEEDALLAAYEAKAEEVAGLQSELKAKWACMECGSFSELEGEHKAIRALAGRMYEIIAEGSRRGIQFRGSPGDGVAIDEMALVLSDARKLLEVKP